MCLQGCVAVASVDLTVVPKWATGLAAIPLLWGLWHPHTEHPAPVPPPPRAGTFRPVTERRAIKPQHPWPRLATAGEVGSLLSPRLPSPPEGEVQGYQTPESLGP